MSISDVALDRKETHLQATSIRKNRSQTRTGRGNYRKSGRHYDGIIHSIGEGCVQYVVLEASTSEKGGETSTKYLDDWLKIGKGLRDMMNVLQLQANHNPRFLPHLQAIGMMNSGSTFQYCRMVNPVGNICLLKRENVLTIPAGLNGGLRQLLHIITNMMKLPGIVDMTRSWIVSAVEGGFTPEELDRELREGVKSYPVQLSWADEAD